MRRRNLLSATGLALAGGVATTYGLSASEDDPANDADRNASREDRSREPTAKSERAEPDSETDERSSEIADSEGMLVFTYDDSPIEDYTLSYDVHREYDVPGCVAACPGLMGTDDAYLDPGQLREMQANGWGVMSHTYYHRSLGRIRLTEPAHTGDERLYVEANRHGAIADDPLVIFDDKSETTATVAGSGSDSVGEYVELADPIAEDVDASGYVRYPEALMRDVLQKTDAQLEAWGLDVTGFVYTYGRYHGVIEELVRDHHDAVANHRYGGGHNELEGLDPTTMQRMYVETDKASEDDVDAFMETAADEDVLAIVGGHSQFDTLTEDRLRYTIESALEHDLAIVTMEEALAEVGKL
ncbi:polysaccharide deacetylase family protein [Natronococcus occultus]|uniref:Polysaccharide deacetylase n=1 Tax=Natronococcus occultus SP4 TaxID=694430 RepID=L0JU15_9EURY|nr:polysaccharide deacetylase family protein [Natronococcus occultus]AGB36246.1 Polysaccharide deacetylase [Natronococcus occultus SP4]